MAARLRPLRDDEFDAFIERGKADYARDMVEHGGAPPEQAQHEGRADWALLLPTGRVPPGHYLFAVEDEETGERVGDLWFARARDEFEGDGRLRLLDRDLRAVPRPRLRRAGDAAARGRGPRARSRPHGLNVFGGNEIARSLYRSLGYAESAVSMAKQLDSAQS